MSSSINTGKLLSNLVFLDSLQPYKTFFRKKDFSVDFHFGFFRIFVDFRKIKLLSKLLPKQKYIKKLIFGDAF